MRTKPRGRTRQEVQATHRGGGLSLHHLRFQPLMKRLMKEIKCCDRMAPTHLPNGLTGSIRKLTLDQMKKVVPAFIWIIACTTLPISISRSDVAPSCPAKNGYKRWVISYWIPTRAFALSTELISASIPWQTCFLLASLSLSSCVLYWQLRIWSPPGRLPTAPAGKVLLDTLPATRVTTPNAVQRTLCAVLADVAPRAPFV